MSLFLQSFLLLKPSNYISDKTAGISKLMVFLSRRYMLQFKSYVLENIKVLAGKIMLSTKRKLIL